MRVFFRLGAMAVVLTLSYISRSANADIVQVGSTFDVQLNDAGPGPGPAPIIFNGTPQSISGFNGTTVTVTENQTSLGADEYQIEVSFASVPGQDLFPVIRAGTDAGISIGGFADPLELTAPFDLTSAVLTFTRGNGSVYASADFIHFMQSHSNPWDGYFPESNGAAGFRPAVGVDIERVDVVLEGDVIAPLPSVAWAGATLLGALALLCRRRESGWGIASRSC